MTHPVPTEIARAKVNLALHVVGRRADGYHLLDSVVAFPPMGDVVTVEADDRFSLTVTGPGAAALGETAADDNLVLRAARGMAAIAGAAGARLTLEKTLPVAGGIGGGSADAAATLRLLARHWGVALADPRVVALALGLGADVPMCLASRPLRAGGIGEAIALLGVLPALGLVLVNPRLPVSTPAVFGALDRRDNAPLPAEIPTGDADAFLAALADHRNDLQTAACRVQPAIVEVLAVLDALPEARLVRMSGSGATCFALCDDGDHARAAADRLARSMPGWWVAATTLG